MAKLCHLLSSWPAGVVGVQPWLQSKQIYRQLSNKYAAHGWLTKIGSGAYVRAGEKVTWQGGVYALQQGLNLKVHIGGITSLELLGRTHFVPMGSHRILRVYVHDKSQPRHLPKWFLELEQISVEYATTQLFNSQLGMINFNCGNFSIQISATERALFEMLARVPEQTSFEHACLLMEHQNSLRFDLVQQLLQECKSQLLKRLFLYLARKFELDCLSRLDLSKIDLGRGPRHVGSSPEVFDADLNLYVPKISAELDNNQEVPDV